MDFVFPYVNCTDPLWQKDYCDTVRLRVALEQLAAERYRDYGTLRYVFRGVAKYMPFVDRIVLIVSRDSQVPEWVNRDTVRIVKHDEFMPERFLPTFSSSAIESLMYNIEGLSEQFIYSNDDMFPVGPMTEDDLFTDGLPRLKFIKQDSDHNHRNSFLRACRNGIDMVGDALGLEQLDKDVVYKPFHVFKPMLVSDMKAVGEMCESRIYKTITPFRNGNNVTGYIYQYYALLTGRYRESDLRFRYYKWDKDPADTIIRSLGGGYQVVCVNDGVSDDYPKMAERLIKTLDAKLPEPCRYERVKSKGE